MGNFSIYFVLGFLFLAVIQHEGHATPFHMPHDLVTGSIEMEHGPRQSQGALGGFGQFTNGFIAGFTAALQGTVTGAGALFDGIGSAANSTFHGLLAGYNSTAQGLVQGVTSIIGNLSGVASNATDAVINATTTRPIIPVRPQPCNHDFPCVSPKA